VCSTAVPFSGRRFPIHAHFVLIILFLHVPRNQPLQPHATAAVTHRFPPQRPAAAAVQIRGVGIVLVVRIEHDYLIRLRLFEHRIVVVVDH
jgi:hypothetical protein